MLAYGYDNAGNKTSLTTTYTNGDERSETYTYDELNRLVSVTDNASQTTTFTYDAVGNQLKTHYPNGLVSVNEYDNLNRVTAVTTSDANGNVLSRYAYSLDVTGRRLGLTEHTGRSSTFSYDDVYRLTQESITDTVNGDYLTSYQYDAVGNRTSQTVNGAETSYVYDDNDRLLSISEDSLETTYDYDAQGNQLAENDGTTVKTYSYNAQNKLTDFSDGTSTIVYQYNPDGIRVNKTLNGALTSYVVDSNQEYAQVIAELDDTDTLLKAYLYGMDLIAQEIEGDWRFYHYDSLGTTRALSNSSGDVSDAYEYSAFGKLTYLSGDTVNKYLFTGEEFDTELDNYYLRERYYNYEIGRFTQLDTWQGSQLNPLTHNKYAYANDDPSNTVDPSGNVGFLDVGIANHIRSTLALSAPSASFTSSLSIGGSSYTFGLFSAVTVGIPLAVVYSDINLVLSETENTDAPTSKDAQKDKEYKAMKSFCDDQKPESSSNHCADLSKLIEHAEQCTAMYEAWDNKWLKGRHTEKIAGWKNRITRLKDEHRRRCTNK